MNKCPRCGSKDVKIINYLGIKTTKCDSCGFDESASYDIVAEQKTSQKAKGRYSPYKTGGKGRTKAK